MSCSNLSLVKVMRNLNFTKFLNPEFLAEIFRFRSKFLHLIITFVGSKITYKNRIRFLKRRTSANIILLYEFFYKLLLAHWYLLTIYQCINIFCSKVYVCNKKVVLDFIKITITDWLGKFNKY